MSSPFPPSLLPVVRVCDNLDLTPSPPTQIPFLLSSSDVQPVGFLFQHVFEQLVIDISASTVPEFTNLATFPTTDGAARVYFVDSCSTFGQRSSTMAAIAASWKQRELFPDALGGWRAELYTIYGPEGSTTAGSDEAWGLNGAFALERAACALFGVGTFGIHVNGWVEDEESGDVKIWVPRRSKTKQTFPSMLDQIVAGGLTHGLSPLVCVTKECGEEASIPEELILERGRLKAAGVITYTTRVKEGWIQPGTVPTLLNLISKLISHSNSIAWRLNFAETQYIYDLKLPPDFTPTPSDGEAESFEVHPHFLENLRYPSSSN